ncbi:MAG: efflux RND transporter periplasmic adaptor subunit [Planctomycetes bacterium]|nr:efflux RND transporter periplasmic adaptor subunit [Planctomycetota bacterium]
MKKVLLLLGILGVAGAGIVAVTKETGNAAAAPGGIATVENGDFRITVIEEGTFAAKDWVSLAVNCEVFWAELTIVSIVKEGTNVKQGDILMEVDSSQLRQQIGQQELEVQVGMNELMKAEEDLKVQRLQNQLDKERLANDLEDAKLDLESWIEKEAPKKVKDADSRIAEAQTAYADAEDEYKMFQQMLKEDLISKAEARRAETKLEKTRADYESAKLSKDQLEKYDIPRETRHLEFAAADKKLYHDSKLTALESEIAQKEANVLKAMRAKEQREDHLRKLKADLERMKVRAPRDGILLYGGEQRMADQELLKNLKIGGRIQARNPVLTIPSLSSFRVTLSVNEGDVHKVQQGQTAEIRPEAIPNMVFGGKVSKVSRISGGNQDWWAMMSGGAGRFAVEVEVEGVDSRICPGMKCKVEILIEEIKGVLHVPFDAVFDREGKSLCYILDHGKAEPRIVKTGRFSHDVIEILEGLKVGETVTLYDPMQAN